MRGHSTQPEADPGQAPRGLVEALRRADHADARLPAGVDLGVLGASQRAFARRRQGRMLRRGAAGLASAAAIALVAWISWPTPAPAPRLAAALPGDADADGDGVIDMLDALIVANAVRDGRADPRLDLTGDGAVTRADVDLVAIAAVRIQRETATP